jgi:hypothetical protein
MVVTHIDANGASFRAFTTSASNDKALRPAGPTEAEGRRFSFSRALASAVYSILFIPLAIVICAIVAFAVLPLHSDSRWDDSYD